MAQNITSAVDIRIRGWVVGSGCPSDTMVQLCAKEAVNGLQTTLQDKAGCLITVMDNWEQLHTNNTLSNPVRYCHSLFRALQGYEKAIWKSRLGYL